MSDTTDSIGISDAVLIEQEDALTSDDDDMAMASTEVEHIPVTPERDDEQDEEQEQEQELKDDPTAAAAAAAAENVTAAKPTVENTACYKNCAVQIVSIGTEEDAYAFAFHEEALTSILDKIPKEDLVAVVSVVGAFRTGKSFLLNWFLRYLNADIGEDGVVEKDWYTKLNKVGGGPGGEVNPGFHWRGGSERNTTGIWMWSEPFQRIRPDGSTISLLLVDTQGMFDHETTMALTAAIFGLSTLLSSYQIYNVDKRIQEDNLQQLALFSEYGRMALDKDKQDGLDKNISENDENVKDMHVRPPFQKLDFLVRDWQNYEDEEDEELMDKEMKEYLQSVFKERDAKDLQETRQHISESFEQVSCFMLTHPGFAVTKKKYEGSVKAVDDTFLTLLDRYCRKVFDSKDLEPKQIHGRFLKSSELGAFIKAYALLFKSGATFPEAGTMLDATAAANNTVAISSSVEKYVTMMDEYVGPDISAFRNEDELHEYHGRILERSLKEFSKIANFGSTRSIEMAREKVLIDVNQRFYTYEKLNQSRNPLSGFETFIVPSIIAVLSYILRSISDMTCSSWSQTCKAGSDALSHILAVACIFLGIVYFTKAKHMNEKISKAYNALKIMFGDTEKKK